MLKKKKKKFWSVVGFKLPRVEKYYTLFLFNKITEIFNTAPSEEVLLANHYIKSYLVLEG